MKSTAKAATVDLLKMNTLRGIPTAIIITWSAIVAQFAG